MLDKSVRKCGMESPGLLLQHCLVVNYIRNLVSSITDKVALNVFSCGEIDSLSPSPVCRLSTSD